MPAAAQELAPRAYWPAPNGTQVLSIGVANSTGDIIVDPSLPIVGVESDIWLTQIGFLQTFSLAGRTATLLATVPYSKGITEGIVQDEFRSRHLSGMADAHLRLAVNLTGAPTMDRAGFQQLRAAPRPLVGASFEVVLPTGRYEPDRVLNLGTNRWAFRPGLGMIYPIGPTWLAEVELAAWLFGDNDDFVGTTREQAPVVSGSFHLIKRLRPGFWASLDLNVYGGGRTTVGGDLELDLQRNSRVGLTMVFPFKGRHAIRPSFSFGAVTRSGGDFTNFALTYQLFLQ
jgi:hypothetical protein